MNGTRMLFASQMRLRRATSLRRLRRKDGKAPTSLRPSAELEAWVYRLPALLTRAHSSSGQYGVRKYLESMTFGMLPVQQARVQNHCDLETDVGCIVLAAGCVHRPCGKSISQETTYTKGLPTQTVRLGQGAQQPPGFGRRNLEESDTPQKMC